MKRYDEVNQDPEWRNELAKQVNTILTRAEYARETSNDDTDREFAEAAEAIADRVAKFEELICIDAEMDTAR